MTSRTSASVNGMPFNRRQYRNALRQVSRYPLWPSCMRLSWYCSMRWRERHWSQNVSTLT